jgi:hypothetical protein
MNTIRRILRAAVPRRWRLQTGLAFGEIVSASVRRDLARIASGSKSIIIGPWLGEVGFELLYWIPFVAWFTDAFGVDSERLVVISRGGVRSWYRHLGARYSDAFDYFSPAEFSGEHHARVSEFGEQKQIRLSAGERALIDAVRGDLTLTKTGVLHPSTMYRVLRPYWWGHASVDWVHRHTRYQRLMRSPEWPVRSDSYVAVKFYFNECFPETAANRSVVTETVSKLARENRVISLSTGLQLDDHRGVETELENVERIEGTLAARNNLEVQTAIVANARSFVGTYGGFSYLAPFYGVPSTGVYSREDGFSRRHLELASQVFRKLSDRSLLTLSSVSDAPAPTPAFLQ